MSITKLLRDAASSVQANLRQLWKGLRLEDPYRYGAPIKGFRQARTGKHKDTRLNRHEQRRNPPGSKLWRACPEKRPHDKNWYENVFPYRWMGKPVS